MLILLIVVLLLSPLKAESKTKKEIYAQNHDSIIMIQCLRDEQKGEYATAFSINKDGTFVSVAHIFNDCQKIILIDDNHKQIKFKKLSWKDNNLDLALFEAEAKPPLKLATEAAAIGEEVVLISNSLMMQNTLSAGYLSGFRKLAKREVIQHTAQSAHGSSGAPLFNENGEVIGVIVGMMKDSQGVNFAVPVKFIKKSE